MSLGSWKREQLNSPFLHLQHLIGGASTLYRGFKTESFGSVIKYGR